MTCKTSTLFAAAALGLVLASCRQITGPEPPRILYGQEECARCRMIISEERFACALVTLQSDGTYAKSVFDDINCVIDFEESLMDADVVARYVHDHDSLAWIDAQDAWFVRSESLSTPMASGVAAFSTRAQAEAVSAKLANGITLDAAALFAQFESPRHAARELNP